MIFIELSLLVLFILSDFIYWALRLIFFYFCLINSMTSIKSISMYINRIYKWILNGRIWTLSFFTRSKNTTGNKWTITTTLWNSKRQKRNFSIKSNKRPIKISLSMSFRGKCTRAKRLATGRTLVWLKNCQGKIITCTVKTVIMKRTGKQDFLLLILGSLWAKINL
jgi:hypothetical protein